MCTVLKVIQNVKKYDLFRVKIAHSIHLFFGEKLTYWSFINSEYLKKNYPVITNFKFAFAIFFICSIFTLRPSWFTKLTLFSCLQVEHSFILHKKQLKDYDVAPVIC